VYIQAVHTDKIEDRDRVSVGIRGELISPLPISIFVLSISKLAISI